MLPEPLRNLDLIALDGALASSNGKRIDLTNMVDAVVVAIYNRVHVEPVPTTAVYMDLLQLNRTRDVGNAIFRALGMDTRGKEWSSAIAMPNSFAALHTNITDDGTRGVEKATQEFAVGILGEGWQAYLLVRDNGHA